MKDFVEILAALNKEPGAISVSYQQIASLHKLILDELPYGQIDPSGIVQGLIEVDGPAQTPPNAKKPLQWHFGGEPYEVCKAIRIQYGYQKYVDGLQTSATGSLFIGYHLDTAYPPPETLVDARIEEYTKAAEDQNASLEERQAGQRKRAALTLVRDNLKAAHEVRRIRSSGSRADFVEALRSDLAIAAGTVTRVAIYVDTQDFDTFIGENAPFAPLDSLTAHLVSGHNPGPTGVRTEFDGPARDNNSKNPFPYSNQTLLLDQSGVYEKLLWWYFGGRAFRITKAMRIGLRSDLCTGSLLIGYQGPSVP